MQSPETKKRERNWEIPGQVPVFFIHMKTYFSIFIHDFENFENKILKLVSGKKMIT